MVYFTEVFTDLYSRFLLSEIEHKNTYRIYYQIQQAYWFYLDFYIKKFPYLPNLTWYDFSYTFVNIIYPDTIAKKFDLYFNNFSEYQMSIPVCGCVLVDKSKKYILLLKAKSWSFPKGKINQGEQEKDCAIRECYEETGIKCVINSSTPFIKLVNPKPITLYIINDIDINTPIKIQSNEISFYKWVKIKDLYKYNCLGNKEVYDLLAPKHIDYETFNTYKTGWNAEDMFKTNEQKFNCKSTYNISDYCSIIS